MKRSGASSSSGPPLKKVAGSAGAIAPWSMKLLDSMKDPKMIVRSDDLTVTIKDAYPKAKHHYLVLPQENISNLRALNRAHLNLLEKMLKDGKAIAENVKSKEEGLVFKYGYHASPSMARLHMHVISKDLDSPCLKNKKHWNSFTTDFFVEATKVISLLHETGKVELDVKGVYEPLLKLPLKCHVCHVELKNMPKLKDHIKRHM